MDKASEKPYTVDDMSGRRRLQQLLGFGFLGAGVLLLSTVVFVWLLASRPPQASGRVFSPNPAPGELPPALAQAPAVQATPPAAVAGDPGPVGEMPEADAPVTGAPETGVPEADAPPRLLPESPLFLRQLAAGADRQTAEAGEQVGRIQIPALGVDAPLQAVSLEARRSGGRDFWQWAVPDAYAAGWHSDSAAVGTPGHIVLNGHNNVHGAIFGDLAHLPVGEQIVLQDGEAQVVYRVVHHELLREAGASLRERVDNARWIAPGADDRLTLVTCWPNTTNSHRLIVVAEPLETAQ
jgi:LPXTG-site transpeptidase (sortase) family protein